jgi:hypothetical protein
VQSQKCFNHARQKEILRTPTVGHALNLIYCFCCCNKNTKGTTCENDRTYNMLTSKNAKISGSHGPVPWLLLFPVSPCFLGPGPPFFKLLCRVFHFVSGFKQKRSWKKCQHQTVGFVPNGSSRHYLKQWFL